MHDLRHFMSETKLKDGSVLLAGGYPNSDLATAEIWMFRRLNSRASALVLTFVDCRARNLFCPATFRISAGPAADPKEPSISNRIPFGVHCAI
jgi:hypothetical protein